MTLDSTTSKVQYTQSGTTTAWPVPYKFLDNEDLIVITTVDGVDTTLVLDTDYTVTGAGDDAGGTVTISPAVAAGTRVTIYRVVDLDQPTELTTAGGWFPKVHEAVFDRLTMQIQQVNEVADRALRLAVTSTIDPEAAVDDLFTARDEAVASASSAASSAAAAQVAANSVGVLSASGTLTTGQDTITLPWSYDTSTGNLAVFLGGVKQVRSTLTFLTSTTVRVGAAVTENTPYEVTSVTLSAESVLTGIRDQCATAKTGAETARTGAETARTGAETAKTAAEAARDVALSTLGKGFHAAKSANQTGIGSNVYTKITYPTVVWDTDGWYDSATSRFTPAAGRYLVTAAVYYSGGVVDGSNYRCLIYKNGTGLMENYIVAKGNNYAVVTICAVVEMTGTDYLEIYGEGEGGQSITAIGNTGVAFFQAHIV